jgi:hypothetical protein
MQYSVRLVVLAFSLVACSSPPPDPGNDAAVTHDDASTADGGGADAGAPVDAAMPARCAPGASCDRVGACLAELDQAGIADPALRITQLDITSPAPFTTGLFRSVIANAVTPDAPACNLTGDATTNWILQLVDGGTNLRFGGGRARTSGPYVYVDEMIGGVPVQPVTVPISTPPAVQSAPFDIVLPIFLDAAGAQAMLLPLHHLAITMTTDASVTCVGSYDAAGLDPANACLPDATTPAFIDAGHIEGFITLEDADSVVISSLDQSLCVFMSGNATMYGDGARPAHCRRTGGVIDFQGDWCQALDAAASPSCADAMHLEMDFAASGVPL